MNNLAYVTTYIQQQPWALHPAVLQQLLQLVRMRASGEKFTKEQVADRIGQHGEEKLQEQSGIAARARSQGVAVIPVFGTIAQHARLVNQLSGPRGTSCEAISRQLRAAVKDPDIKAIALNIESPGGGAFGLNELAVEMRELRKEKKIVAVANAFAASAAYWIAVSSSEISVTPSGLVGSVGVWTAHEDLSKALEAEGVDITLISAGKFKVEGNPFEPLSDEAREAIQERVDKRFDMFVEAIAKGRGVSPAAARKGFGEGRMVLAEDAVREGMADRVETLEQAIARVGRRPSGRSRSATRTSTVAAAASFNPDEQFTTSESEAAHSTTEGPEVKVEVNVDGFLRDVDKLSEAVGELFPQAEPNDEEANTENDESDSATTSPSEKVSEEVGEEKKPDVADDEEKLQTDTEEESYDNRLRVEELSL